MATRPQYCFTIVIYHFKVNTEKDLYWLSKNVRAGSKYITAVTTVKERRHKAKSTACDFKTDLSTYTQQLHF